MHSFGQVFRGPLVDDLEPFSGCDPAMTPSRFRIQLAHRFGARDNDLAADVDQLMVPGLEHVLTVNAHGDPLEERVALLEDAAQACERSRVAGLDLDEHLVEEASPQLGTSLDQPEVVRPEKRDAEVARKVVSTAPRAIYLDRASRPLTL